jgi:hypothetical protein
MIVSGVFAHTSIPKPLEPDRLALWVGGPVPWYDVAAGRAGDKGGYGGMMSAHAPLYVGGFFGMMSIISRLISFSWCQPNGHAD